MRKFNLSIIAATSIVATSAYAHVSMSLVGLGNMSDISVTNAPTSFTSQGQTVTNVSATTEAKLAFGGGILFNAYLGMAFSFEFGGLYVPRKTQTTTSYTFQSIAGSTQQVTLANYLQFPLLARLWLNKVISLGVGGYYAQGIGNVITQDTSGNQTGSQSFSDAQLKTADYGLIGSLQLQIPFSSHVGLLLDGRYILGLADVDNTGNGESQKYKDIQVLAGLTFHFGAGGH